MAELQRSVASWNLLLSTFSRIKDVDKVEKVYGIWQRMQADQAVQPDWISHRILASAFSGNASLAGEIVSEAQELCRHRVGCPSVVWSAILPACKARRLGKCLPCLHFFRFSASSTESSGHDLVPDRSDHMGHPRQLRPTPLVAGRMTPT